MNIQLILRTNLKWFMLVNSATTLAFLPVMAHFVQLEDGRGVGVTAAAYGAIWFLSGLVAGIADGASKRGLHRELAYAAFMLLAALYVLLVGKTFWPAVIPMSWPHVVLVSALAAVAFVIIQVYVSRQRQGYTKHEIFP